MFCPLKTIVSDTRRSTFSSFLTVRMFQRTQPLHIPQLIPRLSTRAVIVHLWPHQKIRMLSEGWKSVRAQDICCIPAAMLKVASYNSYKITYWFKIIINHIWVNENLLSEWTRSIMPIFRKRTGIQFVCQKSSSDVVNSDIVIRKFQFRLYYYVHFQTNALGKDKKSLIPPTAIG